MKNMKKILSAILIFILMCVVVIGNVNVDIEIDTDGGDAEINVNPNTGTGDTTYILDGVNYKDSVSDLNNRISEKKQLNLKTVWYGLHEIFLEWDYQKREWTYRDPRELKPSELRLRQAFDLYFATEIELNYVQQDLSQLQLEVLAMQKLFSEEDLCKGRLLVSEELDIKTVFCGNTTYKNTGKEFIGVQYIKKEEVEPKIIFKKPVEPLVPSKETLDRYKELCDKGIPKFCRVLNTYKHLYEEPKIIIDNNDGNLTQINISILEEDIK